jgi:hypothetical protein
LQKQKLANKHTNNRHMHTNRDLAGVQVGGEIATCASPCGFEYTTTPEMVSTSASIVRPGDVISVSVTGLDSTTCSNNRLVFEEAGAMCQGSSCANGAFSCTIPQITAGRYRVFVEIQGQGRARGAAMMTVQLSISSVQSALVGLGGGSLVAVQGNSFSEDALDSKVSVCGVPCTVTQVNSTLLSCMTSRLRDRAAVPERFALEVRVASGQDDAYEYMTASGRTIVKDDVALGFNLAKIGSNYQSIQTAYMRFMLDVPNGANIMEARLHVRAERESCTKWSHLRIRVQATDHAEPIESWRTGSLSARNFGTLTDSVLWTQETRWRWPEEDQESADISVLLDRIVKRPGWRAGNAVLVSIVQENHWGGIMQCRIMSYEAGERFAPLLRLRFTAPVQVLPSAGTNTTCGVSFEMQAVEPTRECTAGAGDTVSLRGRAYASSEQVPPPTQNGLALAKDAYPKLGNTLSFEKGVDLCAKHAARLCMFEEIFDMR